MRSLTTDAILDTLMEEQRKTKLTELFLSECHLPGKDEEKLLSLLVKYHNVFSLKDGERGGWK